MRWQTHLLRTRRTINEISGLAALFEPLPAAPSSLTSAAPSFLTSAYHLPLRLLTIFPYVCLPPSTSFCSFSLSFFYLLFLFLLLLVSFFFTFFFFPSFHPSSSPLIFLIFFLFHLLLLFFCHKWFPYVFLDHSFGWYGAVVKTEQRKQLKYEKNKNKNKERKKEKKRKLKKKKKKIKK